MREAHYHDTFGRHIVRSLSDENYQQIVNGVAQSYAFDELIAAGASSVSRKAKTAIRYELDKAGIPFTKTRTDRDLEDIANAIVCHSFSRE